MKFKLTTETKFWFGWTLYRVEALIDFGSIRAGDRGGFVEAERNLSQDGNAWVFGNAQVSDNARVFGNAQVSDNARVFGNAQVADNAWVFGNAQVSDNARVFGNVRVSGNARVSPLHIQGLTYPVTITDSHIRIGCEFHTIDEWCGFDDAAILKMDGKTALKFWRAFGPVILAMCDGTGRGQRAA